MTWSHREIRLVPLAAEAFASIMLLCRESNVREHTRSDVAAYGGPSILFLFINLNRGHMPSK